MGGSTTRQTTSQNTSNTFGRVPGASSPDIDAARDFEFSHDPRVPYTFARAFERVKDTYNNTLGGRTTPQLQDAVLRTAAEDIGQQEGQAYAEEGRALQGLEFAKLMDIANMTAPPLVQTNQSSSGSGTQTQTQSPINSIIGGASSIGSALIM